MKISKRLVWCFIVLISALFIFGLGTVLFMSTAEGAADINIIHDGYAETQAYKAFFMVFSEELLQFMKENRDKISGQHRVFILEFYRVMYPDDKMIFIYLDLDKSLKEPLLVNREKISKLTDVKSIRVFAGKTVENLIRIIGENESRKREM